MASAEHLELSTFIKETHKKLRMKYQETKNAEKVWEEHCQNEEHLKEYAEAMHTLATTHWTKSSEENSRIEWIRNNVTQYFHNDHVRSELQKDKKSVTHTLCECLNIPVLENAEVYSNNWSDASRKIKVLDVGSCYNPFSIIDDFEVVAIDLYPAVPNVKKCDFLKSDIGIDDDFLMRSSFDVVIFCLLLEYLPSPQQRFICCRKAAELLHNYGLLIIITPDSKHQLKNSSVMRKWRVALGMCGFIRIKYEKHKHVHSLVYRKAPCVHISEHRIKNIIPRIIDIGDCETNVADLLEIPQDKVCPSEKKVVCEFGGERENCDDEIADFFNELPCESD